MMTRRQQYDALWLEAEALHQQFDPCHFANGVCAEGERDGCCGCEGHVPGRPCRQRSLGCKLHICHDVGKRLPYFAEALKRLRAEARRRGFSVELFSTFEEPATSSG